MNTQAIQKKLDEYMETATPEQIVKEFEDLGVEFVNINNMNLIQQLQQTSKWKEFDAWYEIWRQSHSKNYHTFNLSVFKEYCIDIQKGVFEKFIESRGYNVEKQLHDIPYEERAEMSEKELLKVRYKEAWFIRTAVIVSDTYTPVCLNPIDNYLNRVIPFDSFEELLIWYFNN